jgi:hypothetical protein
MNTPQTPNLWDMYAMHALQGILSNAGAFGDKTLKISWIEFAGLLADDMLKESMKRRDAE